MRSAPFGPTNVAGTQMACKQERIRKGCGNSEGCGAGMENTSRTRKETVAKVAQGARIC